MPGAMQQSSQELAKISKDFGGVTSEMAVEVSSAAVAAAAKAEVESAYVMAMHRPRNEEDARTKIKNSCLNLTFARKSLYNKPVGKVKRGNQWVDNYAVGPSIRFAEEMMRRWGNIKTLQTAIFEGALKRIIKITVIDLETNISYSKDITIEKIVERKNAYNRDVLGERLNSKGEKIFIVRATEDEVMQKESALASKTIRNNGLRLIPQHIIDEATENINATVKTGVDKDPEAAIRQLLDEFSLIGVVPSEIELHTGCPAKRLTADQVFDLHGALNAIKDGQFTWTEYISGKPAEEAKVPEKGDLGALKPSQDPTTPVADPIAPQPASEAQITAIQAFHTQKNIDVKQYFVKYNKADYSELTHKEAEEIIIDMQKKL